MANSNKVTLNGSMLRALLVVAGRSAKGEPTYTSSSTGPSYIASSTAFALEARGLITITLDPRFTYLCHITADGSTVLDESATHA